MMPTAFDGALDRYLNPRDTPPNESETCRLDGLGRVSAGELAPDRRLPAPADPAGSWSDASLADWAARGEIVTLFSKTLGAEVHLAPTPEAVRELVEAGVPRARVYLPGEMAGLRALFTLPPPRREVMLRTLDAIRDVFGEEVEVEVVICALCHGTAWWRLPAGQTVCRRCHPPAPGAEAGQ